VRRIVKRKKRLAHKKIVKVKFPDELATVAEVKRWQQTGELPARLRREA
jgi:hypothetical protein